jgi:NAD(P)-dependent dehydrogenase (short-subunit alcohol dehydrogenase family)
VVEQNGMFDLTGKVCVVTGGSRGLGRAMCLAFARSGASVMVASRKLEACRALAAEITATTGADTDAQACHVGRWADCDALVQSTLDRFGRIDVMVNNAGVAPLYRSLGEVTESLFDKVIDVNLRGPFRLSILAGDQMLKTGGGSIINVSSISATQPGPSELPYGAAKAGLNALTIGLARCFGPTVRANALMPGPFLTDISRGWDDDTLRGLNSIPLERGGDPEEIVGAALYLASDASSFTTGSVIKVDGGMAWAPA